MNVTPQMVDGLKTSPAYQRMLDNPKAFADLFASPAWAIWQEWSETQLEAYKSAALHGDTAEAREESRALYVSFKNFCNLPQFLAKLQEKVLADPSPGDLP